MVTIITTTYNAERTISQTIASVRKVKNKEIEYVVIDGLSQDNTCNIIRKNLDIIDYFISEKDDGIYDAINKGLSVARGDYTLFLAADDLLIPGSIDCFLRTVKTDTDIWAGNIICHNNYGYFVEKSDRNLEKLKHECSLRHPATFFRRSSFKKYGYYDPSFKCSGDREIFLRFYILGAKFQVEDYPIEIFNDGGISTSNPMGLPVKEGIRIEKKYGIFSSATETLNQRHKLKHGIKNSFLGRIFCRFFYSDLFYSFYSHITRKQITKISKKTIYEIMSKGINP